MKMENINIKTKIVHYDSEIKVMFTIETESNLPDVTVLLSWFCFT